MLDNSIQFDLEFKPEFNEIRYMLTKIEALNYRALRYINQPLLPFQVLVVATY